MTAQAHEIIIIDGEETSMAYCPEIPIGHPRVEPCSIPKDAPNIIGSTANWRQYIGTWKIEENKFYLAKIVGVFRVIGDEPIFAEWFTGVLRIPRGEMLEYVHMGFGSVYEEELHIKIEKGIVTKSRILDNRNKVHDSKKLGYRNLPGGENRFDGDNEM